MLTDILQRYMMEKLIDEKHPTVEYEHCTNNKQRKKQCTVCQDVCSKSVMNLSRDIQWDDCENCNICAVQCPARAIKSSAINLGKLLELCQSKSGHVVITCRRREKAEADLKLYCVASIPWEVIAYLALEKRVVILKQGCEDCEDQGCLAAFEQTVARTEEFLGAEKYGESVRIIGEESLLPQAPEMSRRELFALFGKRSKDAIGSMLPDDGSVQLDGMVYRKLLTKRMKQLHDSGSEQAFGWSTRVFTENCWGCGICAKVCPHGALEVTEQEGKRYMAHSLWRCERCGICESVCLEAGMSGTRIEYVMNPMPPVLTALTYDTCRTCGSPVKTGKPLCFDCAAKRPAGQGSPFIVPAP